MIKDIITDINRRETTKYKHPLFQSNVIQSAVCLFPTINQSSLMINDSCVLVVNKIPGEPKTQSDYYIQYVVDFK